MTLSRVRPLWPRSTCGRVLVILALILVLFAVLHRPILRAGGRWLIRVDEPATSDLIVVLGGESSHRVAHAIELWEAGLAPRIALTGPEAEFPDVEEPTYVRWLHLLHARGVPETAVSLLQPSHSTFDDAVLIRDEMARSGLSSVILVTDAYHTRRAGWIVRRMLPRSHEVRMVASKQAWFAPERWWEDERQFLFVVLEYLKFAYYVRSYGLSGSLDGTPSAEHALGD